MSDTDHPQIYLITPPVLDLDVFPGVLAQVLDSQPIACLRLDLATRDEDTIGRAADACREVCHTRDVAIVVTDHVELAVRFGLDGVHLSDAARSIRGARKTLGDDAIVGSFCGTSRHDGMTAGEAGCDYVAFGPVAGQTGDGQIAEMELFQWWSEMIEVPVVAEGALDLDTLRMLSPVTDFVGIGEEIWSSDTPTDQLAVYVAAMV